MLQSKSKNLKYIYLHILDKGRVKGEKRREGKQKRKGIRKGDDEKERRKGERRRKTDELRHSTAKQRRHISPGILSTADQTAQVWEAFGRHNAPFTAQTTAGQCYRLLLCVYVSLSLSSFLFVVRL